MTIKLLKFEELTPFQVYEILKLRAEVFIMGQNCQYLDPDGKDIHSVHLLLEENGALASYLRIIPAGVSYNTASIGRVATLQEFRGKGFSRKAMQTAISFIKNQWKANKITISAQYYLKDFYASLGFVAIGEVYLEENMEHIKMVLTT